jgi:hypothetical protein
MATYERNFSWAVYYKLVGDQNQYVITADTGGYSDSGMAIGQNVAINSRAQAEEVAAELRKDREVLRGSVSVKFIRTP